MKNRKYWLELAEDYDTITREELEQKLFEDYDHLVHVKMRELDREGFLNLYLEPGMIQIVPVRENVYRAV